MVESNRAKLPRCFSCNNCGYSSSTFKAVCPRCGTPDMAVLKGAKGGTVVDFVSVFFPPENLKDLGAYTSVLVRLDNGCRIFGIISDDPKDIRIGASVLIWSYDDDTKTLFFKTA